jgi:hypothetical protein
MEGAIRRAQKMPHQPKKKLGRGKAKKKAVYQNLAESLTPEEIGALRADRKRGHALCVAAFANTGETSL